MNGTEEINNEKVLYRGDNIIEASGVHFYYRSAADDEESAANKKEILKGIDITVKRGEFLAILGHNGSGKSTLAKHFNSILVPTSGKVEIDGMDSADDENVYNIRRKVGMVFQNPDNQIVATIVEEDVAFAPENMGLPPEEIRERVDEALKEVRMYENRDKAPHLLSGGQKQRVAIAGIIAMRPECIVLDEPTAMLDPRGRREVIETVKRLNGEQGITVIMITHYMDEAAQCDRVVVIDEGNILMDGTPKEVFSRVEELEAVGLDSPQAAQLAYELRKEGFDVPSGVVSVKECADAIQKLLEERKGVAVKD